MSRRFEKVLVANRGEIALRVVRACRDAGLLSVAVYADPDRDSVHAGAADEAFALDGSTAAATYLDVAKLLAVAERAGTDAVHPGYGFLSESADFAEAVLAAGLVWIGPPPAAIRQLGDKTAARRVAERVGAPLAPGLSAPAAGAGEIESFARDQGLPVIIKAAFGGGGRGMRVVRSLEEIAPAFELAVREATAAFGRGECFVERFVERARHVETQCLADSAGEIVVVSTRDCSLQRRSQKLVEEAPAPFLSTAQLSRLYESSKAMLSEVGYVGAGTCEYLVGEDGSISFNEVNTRIQVEHPVSEEVTGIDLVREQLRLAAGERLGYGDPVARGHSIEFRINAEDPSAGFVPAAGTISRLRLPSGPGVRYDGGYVEGGSVPASFDSLIGKLIVTGADRRQAIERARRAFGELVLEGLPTVVGFHRLVLDDPAFTEEPLGVHTRYIESELAPRLVGLAASGPAGGSAVTSGAAAGGSAGDRQLVVLEVNGRRVEVSLPAALAPVAERPAAALGRRRLAKRERPGDSASGEGAVTSPMQGLVVAVNVAPGDHLSDGETVVVLEAMKMQQPLRAPFAGVVVEVTVEAGATVQAGQLLCRIEPPSGDRRGAPV